jgi:uncharacterized protein
VTVAVSESALRELYAESRTIAVVGCSSHWQNPACVVPAYMQSHGYRIVPVNPNETELLGEPSVGSLEELSERPDIVDVFRPSDEVPAIAEQAIRLGARCLWLQTGITCPEAEEHARAAGLLVMSDACVGIVHGQLGLGEGVKAFKEARLGQR